MPDEEQPTTEPTPTEMRTMEATLEFTEEMKEALLKARGEGAAIVMVIKDGKWAFLPDAFRAREEDGKVILERIVPPPVTKERRARARAIAERLASTADLASALEAAMLEKSDKQLDRIEKSAEKTGAKVERHRGCFWLVTADEEITL